VFKAVWLLDFGGLRIAEEQIAPKESYTRIARKFTMTIHHLRRDYKYGSLTREQMPSEPMGLFQQWFQELRSLELPEWFELNAMTLATHRPNGGAACRIVLLKEIEPDAFLFFTNYESDKGQEIAADASVALGFYWPVLDRQVRVEGIASKAEADISERYFRSRPRSSQLSANISPQSRPIPDEDLLQKMVDALDQRLAGDDVPRPENWGGYRVRPESIEFWQGRPSRLHDRFRYTRDGSESWHLERLGP
jgi:pyridoxamine 5'-phosphate oxidase